MFERKSLLKKTYVLPIQINNKIRLFEYEQFSVKECLEFDNEWEQKIVWLYNFLNKNWKKYKWFGITRKYRISVKELIACDIEVLYKQILDSALKDFYNFDNKKTDSEPYPVSAYIGMLSKELSISPLDILDNFTAEQLKEFSEWVVWNLNSQTEEWAKKNKDIIARKKHTLVKNDWKTDDLLKALIAKKG